MLDEWHGDDLLVVIGVDEVDVVGEPADGEDDDHHHEHLDNLQHQIKAITFLLMLDNFDWLY